MRHSQDPVYATNSKKNKGGRSEDTEQLKAFEQLTLSELVHIMQKNLESSDKSAYTKVHFKRKLLENYGNELAISNENGKPDIATLKLSDDS